MATVVSDIQETRDISASSSRDLGSKINTWVGVAAGIVGIGATVFSVIQNKKSAQIQLPNTPPTAETPPPPQSSGISQQTLLIIGGGVLVLFLFALIILKRNK